LIGEGLIHWEKYVILSEILLMDSSVNQTWLFKMGVLNLEQVTVVAPELVMISVMVSFTARFLMIR